MATEAEKTAATVAMIAAVYFIVLVRGGGGGCSVKEGVDVNEMRLDERLEALPYIFFVIEGVPRRRDTTIALRRE